MSEFNPAICPFCGQRPEYSRYILGNAPAYDLGCVNEECHVRPMLRAFRRISHAVDVWNSRYILISCE